MKPLGSLTSHRLRLIIWKNILLRRRHKLLTIMQFVLCVLLAAIMILIRHLLEEDLKPITHPDISIPKPMSEIELQAVTISRLFNSSRSNGVKIAYAPNNANSRSIMNRVEEMIKTSANNNPSTSIIMSPFDDEISLQNGFSESILSNEPNWVIAIVFDEGTSDSPTFKEGQVISYKMRLPITTELPNKITHRLTPLPPDKVDPNILHIDPNQLAHSPNPYTLTGITGFQIWLEKAIVQTLTDASIDYNINAREFPIPEGPPDRTRTNNAPHSMFLFIYYLLAEDLIIIGSVLMIPAILSPIVAEKETGIKELMKMMGLPNWMHWVGWVFSSMAVLSLTMTFVVIIWTLKLTKHGPVLTYDDPFVVWVLFMVYATASTSFICCFSVFFHRPVLASASGVMVWLVSYYALQVPLEIKYDDLSNGVKLATALLPNMALHWAVKAQSLKPATVGTKWSNIAEESSEIDDLRFLDMLLMLIFDTIIYLILAVYLENILPSEFGVRKPWYYIFKAETWGCVRKVHPTTNQDVETATDGQPGFEEDALGLVPGITIQNLCRRFGKSKIAVNSLSFKMYTGQITALLGHNGAGKTTTISILTGIIAPTSGTAFISGLDINLQMDQIRSNLGLCPQHNMLFDELTIEDHLIFFGRLKGLTTEEAKREITYLLQALKIEDKRKAFSKSLSGGQKRKLSLMIALIGGTKVVILDEPTSGMDPEARRVIWDLLLGMRGERTIVLTTHFMEEADVLGDRIAIMAGGQIKCCGTPIFLKKFYGTGYNLKLTIKGPEVERDPILALVNQHVESADWKTEQFKNPTDLIISLPNESGAISHFSPMFSDISGKKEELGIVTIGLSLTTMDEVFSKVEELSREEITNPDHSPILSGIIHGKENLEPINPNKTKMNGFSRFMTQFNALIIKRIIYTLKKRRLLYCQLLVPIIVLAMSIVIVNLSLPQTVYPPSNTTHIDLNSHRPDRVTLFEAPDGTWANTFTAIVTPDGNPTKVPDVMMSAVEAMTEDLEDYQGRYVVGAEFRSVDSRTEATGIFSPYIMYTAPLAVNLVSNTILKTKAPDKNFQIKMSFQPLDSILNQAKPFLKFMEGSRNFPKVIPIFGVFIPCCLAILSASYIVFPLEERLCKLKQLQLMTSVTPFTYWISIYVWDIILILVLALLMCICFPIFQYHGTYTANNGIGVFFLILVLYGFAGIPFAYICTFMAKSVSNGFAIVTLVHVLTGTILPMVTQILLFIPPTRDASMYMRHFGRPWPTFGVSMSLMIYASVGIANTKCSYLHENISHLICHGKTEEFPLQRDCCEDADEKFEPYHFLSWTQEFEGDKTIIVPDLGQELTVLFIMGCTYTALLFIIEYGIFHKLKNIFAKTPKTAFHSYSQDDNVLNEIERVKNSGASEDVLVVSGLCKGFGSFAAVSNLSFGVHFGECFGLLGVNGAGKTTTFRMLTGDETSSSGNAFIEPYSLEGSRQEFLTSIGYCPQFDAILGVLTGRQMLALFARLRCVPKNSVRSEINNLLNKLGLLEAGDVQCQNYSGGMKRRLCAGMAMIGDPPIILLDEPTSGVDPVARRQFWQVIAGIRDSGRSVVLTSHSMDECEALCSRLGIMVNGQFQCFGGIQHLKSKFAQGYSLTLKLKSHIHSSSEEAKPLILKVNQIFNPCVLKDEHQNILQYQLMNTDMQWDTLFDSLEVLRKECEGIIEDFSVSETTLEDVFLSFARQQHEHRKTKTSGLHNCLHCKCLGL